MIETNTPCDIYIDKEGTWFFRGAEMFRREIVNYFYQNLKLDASGRYIIELPGDPTDCCYVDVEDTAFVVKAAQLELGPQDGHESILLTLSDDSQELLDPSTLQIGQENVLYCCVRNGRFMARFSRPGYYQLASHIEYDSDKDAFYLRLNSQLLYIQ